MEIGRFSILGDIPICLFMSDGISDVPVFALVVHACFLCYSPILETCQYSTLWILPEHGKVGIDKLIQTLE